MSHPAELVTLILEAADASVPVSKWDEPTRRVEPKLATGGGRRTRGKGRSSRPVVGSDRGAWKGERLAIWRWLVAGRCAASCRSTATKQLATMERAGKVTRTPGTRTPGTRTPDRWSLPTVDRLRPGQLDALVLAHVRASAEPVGPVAVARALGRSSGAVANCLARRKVAGDLADRHGA
jgi:hypothetical protein